MRLLKSQKNEIFDALVAKGFSPAQFNVHEGFEGKVTKTKYSLKDTDYYFLFDSNREVRIAEYSPGEETVSQYEECGDWNDQLYYFRMWLDNVDRELSIPDKWAEYFSIGNKLDWERTEESNTQFSFQEVQEIEAAVLRTKKELTTVNLIPEQLRLIEDQLDYVAEKAKSLGRIDWKNLFVGVLISLVVQYAITPETAKLIWSIVGETFKRVILIALH